MHKSEARNHFVLVGSRYSLGQIAIPLDSRVDMKAGGYQYDFISYLLSKRKGSRSRT